MSKETISVIRHTDSKYGLPIIPRGMKILAIHRWATGHQELCFRDDAHLQSWAEANEVEIKE